MHAIRSGGADVPDGFFPWAVVTPRSRVNSTSEGAGPSVTASIEYLNSPISPFLNESSQGLDVGSYVLMCNIYDEAEKESHYQQGMHTAFTVT